MKLWLLVNLSLAISFIIYRFLSLFFSREQKTKLQRSFLVVLPFLCLIPVFQEHIPQEKVLPPNIKRSFSQIQVPVVNSLEKLPTSTFSNIEKESSLQIPSYDQSIWLYLLGLNVLIWLCSFSHSLLKMRRIINSSFLLKKIGNVKVFISQNCSVAFSCRFFGKNIVLPENIYLNSQKRIMCLAHEMQHHRNGDTWKVYIAELLKSLFFLNPFYHLWFKEWNLQVEIQCDKDVLTRRSFNIKQYAYLIIESAKKSDVGFQGALAMASLNDLSRRIEMITTKEKTTRSIKRLAGILICGLSVWQASAFASDHLVPEKLGIAELAQIVKEMDSEFPIAVNESVLKWVNYYTTDPKGRAFYIQAKANMKSYESLVREVLESKNMPKELLGVPFMESGYSNEVVSPSGKAKGIWQFIASTAKNFGLKVDAKLDERLDVEKASHAAMAYYEKLRNDTVITGDWNLSLLAYNSGESSLRKAIKKQNTRNPWKLKVGDKEYLAKIHAGIIMVGAKKDLLFMHPVSKAKTTSSFGFRRFPNNTKKFHKGVDLAIHKGEIIVNPLSGKVVTVTDHFNGKKSYGKTVVVDHGENIFSRFSHMDSFAVEEGQRLAKGQMIGRVGETGYTTGPHLHYELVVNGKHVDPALYF